MLRGSCPCGGDGDFLQLQPSICRVAAVISQFGFNPGIGTGGNGKAASCFECQCDNIGTDVVSGFPRRQQISYRNCLQTVVGFVVIYIVSRFPVHQADIGRQFKRVCFGYLHRVAVVMVYLDAHAVTVGYTFEGDAIRYFLLFIRQVHGVQSFQNQESGIRSLARITVECLGSGSCVSVQPVEGTVGIGNQLSGCGGNIPYGTDGEERHALPSVSHGDVGDGEMRLSGVVHHVEACHGAYERYIQPHVCPHAVFA